MCIRDSYSNEWHVEHLKDPRSLVPESVMPSYAFLADADLDTGLVAAGLKTNRFVGVPYTDDDIANALADLKAQADPNADTAALLRRYPKTVTGDFDGNPNRLSEMDALIAYLQMLGALVDFQSYQPADGER